MHKVSVQQDPVIVRFTRTDGGLGHRYAVGRSEVQDAVWDGVCIMRNVFLRCKTNKQALLIGLF